MSRNINTQVPVTFRALEAEGHEVDDHEGQRNVAGSLVSFPSPAANGLGHPRQRRHRRRQQEEQGQNTDRHGDLALEIEPTDVVEVLAVISRGQQAEREKGVHRRQKEPHQTAELDHHQPQCRVVVVPVDDLANQIRARHEEDGRQ